MSEGRVQFLMGAVLGLAIGFAGVVGVFDAMQQLKEWQALIAGLFATVVGGTTAALIWHQISIQKRAIDDEKQSAAIGAKAMLPDALAELTQYTQNCIRYLQMMEQQRLPTLPKLRTNAMQAVKDSVRYVDPVSAAQLYAFIVDYQVFNSRLRGPVRFSALELADRIYDATEVLAHINRLYPFARNKQETPAEGDFRREEMLNALRSATIEHLEDRGTAYERAERLITDKHLDA